MKQNHIDNDGEARATALASDIIDGAKHRSRQSADVAEGFATRLPPQADGWAPSRAVRGGGLVGGKGT